MSESLRCFAVFFLRLLRLLRHMKVARRSRTHQWAEVVLPR
jgi:hypothetical protein